MKKPDLITAGISLGDPNGIGSETVLKAFNNPLLFDLCKPVLYAPYRLVDHYKKHFQLDVPLNHIKETSAAASGVLNVVSIPDGKFKINWGTVDPSAGKLSIRSFNKAVSELDHQYCDVLITCPINKESIQSDDYRFPGHTEYLNKQLGGEALMFMVSDQLKVGLLTDHLPITEVPAHISEKRVRDKFTAIELSLKRDFMIEQPKVAVLGINPHVGDNGVIGREDQDILIPALEKLREEGKPVFGPYAADSFFGNKLHGSFHAVLAAYHDQGLIPFKTLTFGEGVNFTAGLSAVRTSPDHGTAFDIAGKGEASYRSFTTALEMAIRIYRNRTAYDRNSQNPLRTAPRKKTPPQKGENH